MDELKKEIDALANSLIPHYSRFDVGNRLLFTGHSHQAWPDIARKGLLEAFEVAARDVDTKWDTVFKKVEILRSYLRSYYDDPIGRYTLGQNTHQLLVAWLSSLPLTQKPKIITTTHEFYSMERQLRRLEEEGIEVSRLEPHSTVNFIEQMEEKIDDNTAAIMLSRVYFDSALINSSIPEIAKLARSHDIPLLIDDYHGTNVVPLSIKKADLQDCFFLIGGYKYLQWGEGNCFLRYPANCDLRPAITGWFASFSTLSDSRTTARTSYTDDNQRFASGTFDGISQFRAAQVVHFFREQELTPQTLRKQYIRQLRYMKHCFNFFSPNSELIALKHEKNLEYNGGFLAFNSPHAVALQQLLSQNDVLTDARGTVLRFGPAPYTTGANIERAMTCLEDCLKSQV